MPEYTDEQLDAADANDRDKIHAALGGLRPFDMGQGDESLKPFDCSPLYGAQHDFSELVILRLQHQTRYAASGIRTRAKAVVGGGTDTCKAELSLRRQIINKYNDILRRQQDQGAGTGAERSIRWNNKATGQAVVLAPLAGNAANAAVVAAASGNEVCFVQSYIDSNYQAHVSRRQSRSETRRSEMETYTRKPAFMPVS